MARLTVRETGDHRKGKTELKFQCGTFGLISNFYIGSNFAYCPEIHYPQKVCGAIKVIYFSYIHVYTSGGLCISHLGHLKLKHLMLPKI